MSRIVWRILLVVSMIASQAVFTLQARANSSPLVAAASSLRTLWPALIAQYVNDTGNPEPQVSFASSGLLSTQIGHGAPFNVFLSADRTSIERLPAQRIAQQATIYAWGELWLVALQDAKHGHDLTLQAIQSATLETTDNEDFRLAIANPVHAPYGKAAQQVLEFADAWPLPAGQLLAAENASQALQFLLSGAVDMAIVPRVLVQRFLTTPSGEKLVTSALPPMSYKRVEHHMVVLTPANTLATGFTQWLQSASARAVLQDAGLQTTSP